MRRSGFGYRFHHVNQAWQKGFDIDQAFEKLFRHTATISKSSLSLSLCLSVCLSLWRPQQHFYNGSAVNVQQYRLRYRYSYVMKVTTQQIGDGIARTDATAISSKISL